MASEKRLIDVNKVINAMQKCIDESPYEHDSIACFAFESIIECLKQEPTVDAVEVVHGRWDRVKFFANATLHHCSICGHAEIKTYNYCPKCGAKMDGDEGD